VASLEAARARRHFDRVVARHWDLVIVDEAHRLKNRSTLAWQLCDRLRSRFLLLLTATPVENDLGELYNIINLLKPGQLATPAEFKQRFVTRGDPTAPRNTETLRGLLSEVMIRNTRSLVDIRLPPRFAHTVKVPCGQTESELYRRLQELLRSRYDHAADRLALATLFEEAGSSPFAVRSTCEKMLARPDIDQDLSAALSDVAALAERVTVTAKADLASEILNRSRAAGEKSVVFSRFRATLEFLGELLSGRGIPHAALHGGLSGVEKGAAVARFAEDIPILLCSEAGAEGRNLQFASTLVNFDLPWSPMRLEQRIGRLHRIGQTREVHIHNFCAAGSPEERILEVLDRRINLFELVIGELDMVLGRIENEQDFEARVLEIYGRSETDQEIGDGFVKLGDELEEARQKYARSKALDRRLFGREFEV
jgi:SNF2 family DNA or RNA helicase